MAKLVYADDGRLLFTEEMKKDYTILAPMMLPVHFALLTKIFKRYGYNLKILDTKDPSIVTEGLQDVHNDTCYPALLVIGQMIDALKSGQYDINKVALMITQTGGGCRASNYIHLLRKALKKNGFEQVPVISLNLSGMEKNPGFKISLTMLQEILAAICLADTVTLLANQTRPYEVKKGETDAVVEQLTEMIGGKTINLLRYRRDLKRIIERFKQIEIVRVPKIKVGIVGEIYIKFSPLGNNDLEKFLAQEGVEVVLPGLLDFIIFMGDHHLVDTRKFHIKYKKGIASAALRMFFVMLQNIQIKTIKKYSDFRAPSKFSHTKSLIKGFVSEANKMGEGWLLTAEMLELIHSGANNIICTQPFGCLPNHIVGKGMIRKIRTEYPQANIVAVDYDPGASRVNQINRIRLMLSNALELTDQPEQKQAEEKQPVNV